MTSFKRNKTQIQRVYISRVNKVNIVNKISKTSKIKTLKNKFYKFKNKIKFTIKNQFPHKITNKMKFVI